MKYGRAAKFTVVFAALILPFIDYAMTLAFIGYPDIQELNPLMQKPQQILTVGVPGQIAASIFTVVTYYVCWVKKWAENSQAIELTVLAMFLMICVVKAGAVFSNVYQTLRLWGVLT